MVESNRKVFTVIGAGEVGGTVTSLINSNFTDVTIHLRDIHPSKSGKVLDLQHAAACNRNTVFYNDPSALSLSDFIVLSAGYSNVHGESRNSVAEKNKALVLSIFKGIQLKPSAVIIVITNPVEPICFWIDQYLGEKNRVIGTGTALDTFRLKYILQERFQCDYNQITTMVIGEHGQHMVPLFSSTTINGIPIANLADQNELEAIEEELKRSAFQIRETERGTKFGVAETTLFILKSLAGKEDHILPVSVPYFDGLNKLYINLPVTISSGNIQEVPFSMDKQEKEKFQAAVSAVSANL